MFKFIIPSFVVVLFVVLLSGSVTDAYAKDKKHSNIELLVVNMAGEALKDLTDNEISDKQRSKRMRALLNKYFDLTAIGRFALGKTWRKASKTERKQYLELFKTMVVDTYAERFKEYSGEEFVVTGSQTLNKRDSIVHSFIKPKDGPKLAIDWRVRNKDDNYRIIDVIIEDVSMGVTQRSEFAAVIQQGGGDIGFLLASLEKQL